MSTASNPERTTRWITTTLGDAMQWGSGGTPRSSASEFYDGDIPWATIGDLSDGPVTETARSITTAGIRNSSAKWVEPGSVLLAMYGSIGKLGITEIRLTTNQAIAFTRPSCCSTKYLFYFLLWARDDLVGRGKGGTQQNISQTVIKAFPFHYPEDTDDQDRVVAQIETQVSRIDAGVAALQRAQANLKRYRASVLKAACEGRLVPTEAELARREGRDYETGAQLLERILAERRKAWTGKGKYKEPEPPDTTGLPELPEGWAVASLEQLTSADRVICYGILMPKDHVPGGVPYVKVRDMKTETIDVMALQRTTPAIAAKYARASLRAGDLLLAIRGTYGRVSETPRELEGGNITQDTARLAISPLLCRGYVAHYLRSEDSQRYFRRVARGVAVKGVNIADVRTCPVAIPAVCEQVRIVLAVERQLTVVATNEAMIAAGLHRATRLRAAVLLNAFASADSGITRPEVV